MLTNIWWPLHDSARRSVCPNNQSCSKATPPCPVLLRSQLNSGGSCDSFIQHSDRPVGAGWGGHAQMLASVGPKQGSDNLSQTTLTMKTPLGFGGERSVFGDTWGQAGFPGLPPPQGWLGHEDLSPHQEHARRGFVQDLTDSRGHLSTFPFTP